MADADDDLKRYFWWHSIRLADGRVTPGGETPELMAEEFARTFGPLDLQGQSVLAFRE
jgi:hypothetical protein